METHHIVQSVVCSEGIQKTGVTVSTSKKVMQNSQNCGNGRLPIQDGECLAADDFLAVFLWAEPALKAMAQVSVIMVIKIK